jgi:hypothetical protein
MKISIISFLIFIASTALPLSSDAFQVQTKVYNTMRDIAGPVKADRETAAVNPIQSEQALLVYHSPDARTSQKTRALPAGQWAGAGKDSSRLDFLLKLYFANVKEYSHSGQRHVGCFFGDAEALANDFFKNTNPIQSVDRLYVTVSEDRKMIGLEFTYTPFGSSKIRSAHFRLPHCVQGAKMPLLEPEILKTAQNSFEKTRSVASIKNIRWPAQVNPATAAAIENGFDVYDRLNNEDQNLEITKNLPRFRLRADYNKLSPNPETRPWKGMDISTEAGAQKFAQVVLDYFFDSFIQSQTDPNKNFDAQNIPADKPKWCHMPWLNVGDSGRELIHGLTKERDLEKSAIYPEVATTTEKQGSDWGIGFYNDIACATAFNVFGSSEQPLTTPDFTKSVFPDGSVSVKVLFTTAKLDALKSSYTWTANVSLPKSTNRRLREVKMVQIDVAVKDSTLKGIRKEADNWMMTTFYFDPNYTAPSRHKFTGPLAGLLKMRPIGVHTGFDPSTSLIFKDSKTNSANNQYYGADPHLMNGPADNPKASCLSCHGAAGTTVSMVPGVKDFDGYTKVRTNGLDFSQQLALAKRNNETRSGQLTEKGWH